MKITANILLLIFFPACLLAQGVTNLRVQQRTDGNFMVDIWYDLVDPIAETANIVIEASNNNGATWDYSITSITGDFGDALTMGTDKHIEWDIYADHPNTSGNQFKIRILYWLQGTMTGNDSREYKTIKIGNQWWMAENLRETKYRSGDNITHVPSGNDWREYGNEGTGIRAVIYDNENYANNYGYHYNWHAVNNNIAPAGWHVPTNGDWQTLQNELGDDDGSKLAGKASLWDNDDLEASAYFGSSGFNAAPGGYGNCLQNFFYLERIEAYFWSATAFDSDYAYYFSLHYQRTTTFIGSSGNKSHLHTVRLVKD